MSADFRLKFREMRMAKQQRQTDFAAQCGISSSELCLYESEKRTPSLGSLVSIAKRLNCTLDSLVELTPETPAPQTQGVSNP